MSAAGGFQPGADQGCSRAVDELMTAAAIAIFRQQRLA